ncbi:ATP-binding cassette domain-containing protein [Iamia sp. SCSIO 61187]|uniref:ABC transporter ATP-binding protein n=1 Tax=Iamia sp. SCSIO 61187 TaxID=2722752 RepID=UPI001C62E356|nr:ATP-binding cassette domain-containing protein [Iamia sp. SCSIO 61187]QYG91967.1 ATP-binding cassette domain-containing protein [Iamia sp. SCSIO 61187]
MASVTFDQVSKQYPNGAFGIRDISLEVLDGELLVLVGPSGCGKSTALRCVAGLEDVTHGSLLIGERSVENLPPKDRDIAMVFQNYALYPHMTVRQNIGFALKLAGRPKAEIASRVDEVSRSLQLEPWLDRKPAQLSGGQRQRVAMGRAIVRDPAVFLMDEPLSNLDAKLRVQVRTEIARLQRELGTTTIYVTHDQTEAMTMGDRVAVLRDGRLQQVAPPEELYSEPDNTFVAAFIGSPSMSLVEGTIVSGDDGSGASAGRSVAGGGAVALDKGDGSDLAVRVGTQTLPVPASVVARRPGLAARVGEDVIIGIRPEDVEAHDIGHREGDVVAPLKAHVELRESLGSELLVHMRIDARPAVTDDTRSAAIDSDSQAVELLERQAAEGRAAVIGRFDPRSKVQSGTDILVNVRVDALHFFDASTGEAIRT